MTLTLNARSSCRAPRHCKTMESMKTVVMALVGLLSVGCALPQNRPSAAFMAEVEADRHARAAEDQADQADEAQIALIRDRMASIDTDPTVTTCFEEGQKEPLSPEIDWAMCSKVLREASDSKTEGLTAISEVRARGASRRADYARRRADRMAADHAEDRARERHAAEMAESRRAQEAASAPVTTNCRTDYAGGVRCVTQ